MGELENRIRAGMNQVTGNELLIGEKVRLTQVEREDLPHFTEWFSKDIALRRLLDVEGIYPARLADEERWFESVVQEGQGHEYVFAIRTLADDHLIGDCDIRNFNWQARHCIIGISVGDPTYRGGGFGSDAVRLLLRFGFLELNMNRIALETYSYNERAIASYLKVGFLEEGRMRQFVRRDGQYYDSLYMSILRREWENQQ
jgi:RimJ/RimL family protein N-acetyltransferase